MKCESCTKYDDCRTGSGLTWPCGAYRPKAGSGTDIEKLIEDLRIACAGNQHNIMGVAATALSTLQIENQALRNSANGFKAENEKLRAELEQVKADQDAAVNEVERLIERYVPLGPFDRLQELAQADREGRCVVLDDLTVADLQQMLTVLNSTRYGDGVETYTTGYRKGHRNGRIEILHHVLGINEGDSAEATLRREQDE